MSKRKADANGQTAEAAPSQALAVSIGVEITTHRPGYCNRVLNHTLTRRQAAALNMLYASLSEQFVRVPGNGARHPEGGVADGHGDGVRYLLEQLADQIELKTGKSLESDFDFVFRG